MSECGCYYGLDCTKISVCHSETVIEELKDENERLREEREELKGQLCLAKSYMSKLALRRFFRATIKDKP